MSDPNPQKVIPPEGGSPTPPIAPKGNPDPAPTGDTTFTIDWSGNEQLKDDPIVKQLVEQAQKQTKLIEDMTSRELKKEFDTSRASILEQILVLDKKQHELDKNEPDIGLLRKSLAILQRQAAEKDQPPPFAGSAPTGHIHVASHKKPGSNKYICQGCQEEFD